MASPTSKGRPPPPLALTHLVGLQGTGGLERDFVEFVAVSAQAGRATHHTLLTGPGVARPLRPRLLAGGTRVSQVRHLGKLRIPGVLRGRRLRRLLGSHPPDAVVLWNNPGWIPRIPGGYPVLYYEHGAAWFDASLGRAAGQLQRLAGILCNSQAARRMLELRYGIPAARIHVCLNAVREDCRPEVFVPRETPGGSGLRLGVAGRLTSIKGFVVAVHVVARLRAAGITATLHVAGRGEEEGRLREVAHGLGVADRMYLLGHVDSMGDFYRGIDLLLCPSLREPFGLVCAEAIAHGVPVIGAAVDGIPEVVAHGLTGLCLEPTLDVGRYKALGGGERGLPKVVFDPVANRLRAPLALDPDAVAAAILDLLAEPGRYQAMSRGGPAGVAARFDYPRHVADVLQAITSCIAATADGKGPSARPAR